MNDPLSLFWGKAQSKDGGIHLLIYHMIDVAACAQKLITQSFSHDLKNHLYQLIGQSEESALRTIAFLIALHDLGKASPEFQSKHPPSKEKLTQAGYPFAAHNVPSILHGTISAYCLETILEDKQVDSELATVLAYTLGGHHGSFPTFGQVEEVQSYPPAWQEAQKRLVDTLQDLFRPEPITRAYTQTEKNLLAAMLAGLTSVADWIGSNTEFFKYFGDLRPLREYYETIALPQAQEALDKLGWQSWELPKEAASFQELFNRSPYPIQQQVYTTAKDRALPAMVIIEAPTGIGKTEMALSLADAWMARAGLSGLYIAMPTMATSNQMYDRFQKYLIDRYKKPVLNLLVHSQARLRELPEQPAESLEDEPGEQAAAYAWFLPSKKSLLAPFGVGTVDQSLLSVLRTKHFFVRMFGLSHKTVIFDEIHAYDAYMSELFQRLLGWLRQLGVSVILLSATLPARTRTQLIHAYLGRNEALPCVPYPRLTCCSANTVEGHSLPITHSQKQIQLEWVANQNEAIVHFLQVELAEGGCAAVICDTVSRAQEIFQTLRSSSLGDLGDRLILFHSRFTANRRAEIEELVLDLFSESASKSGRRQKAIVVATQVIEQSLDLDFDILLSELAPIDLLLQRAGRLHRHGFNDEKRPQQLRFPRFVLLKPEVVDGLPVLGNERLIYFPFILYKTWLALENRSEISLPDQYESLIEAVYSDGIPEGLSPQSKALLEEKRSSMQEEIHKQEIQAVKRLIPKASAYNFLTQPSANLEEDDPQIHKDMRALTRLAEPSIDVVCLHKTEHGLSIDADGNGEIIDINSTPNRSLILKLLGQVVKVQDRELVDFLGSQQKMPYYPASWKKVSALRYHRLLQFEGGECIVENKKIVLDSIYGLRIIKGG